MPVLINSEKMSDEEYVSCLEGSDSGNESPDLYEEDGDSMDSDGVDIGLGEESACSSKSEHKNFNEYRKFALNCFLKMKNQYFGTLNF